MRRGGADLSPNDVHSIGYRVDLPDNVFLDFSQDLDIALSPEHDEDRGQDWQITVTRPAGDLMFAPDLAFEDVIFPAGNAGEVHVLSRLDGSFNDTIDLTISGAATDGSAEDGAPDVCVIDEEGDRPRCNTSLGSIDPESTYAIGYRLDLPDDIFYEFSSDIELVASSSSVGDVQRSWQINASRPADVLDIMTTANFAPLSLPAGDTGTHTALHELNGEINAAINVSAAYDGEGEFLACRISREGDDPECSNNSLAIHPDYFAFGYRFTPSEDHRFEDSADIGTLTTARLDGDQDPGQVFEIGITRPALDLVFAPTLDDSATSLGAARTTARTQKVWFDFGGEMNADGTLRGGGTMKKVCVESQNGIVDCYGTSKTVRWATTVRVGYEVYIPDDRIGDTFPVELSIESTKDASLVRTFTGTVRRSP